MVTNSTPPNEAQQQLMDDLLATPVSQPYRPDLENWNTNIDNMVHSIEDSLAIYLQRNEKITSNTLFKDSVVIICQEYPDVNAVELNQLAGRTVGTPNGDVVLESIEDIYSYYRHLHPLSNDVVKAIKKQEKAVAKGTYAQQYADYLQACRERRQTIEDAKVKYGKIIADAKIALLEASNIPLPIPPVKV